MLLQSKKLVGTLTVLSLLALATPALAQTTASSTTDTTGTAVTTGTSVTTPGAPNTGAGGNTAENLALLAISGLIVVAGGAYLVRKGVAAR